MVETERDKYPGVIRFTLLGVMLFVLAVGLSIAAFREAVHSILITLLWLSIATFLVAALSARFGRGRARDFGFGYALVSGVAFVLFFGGRRLGDDERNLMRQYLPCGPFVAWAVDAKGPGSDPPVVMSHGMDRFDLAEGRAAIATDILYSLILLWLATLGGWIAMAIACLHGADSEPAGAAR